MKTIYLYIVVGLLFIVSSCEIDNYEKPNAIFSGAVTYNGDTIQVADSEVRFQLYQPGYGLDGPFDVWIDQDGSYSGRLSSGVIKVKFLDGQGPWRAPADTIFVDLQGSTEMNLEVTPYYMIRSPQIVISGNAVNASISLEKAITGADARDVENVTLFLNGTTLVSNIDDYNIAQADGDSSNLSSIKLSVNIPEGYGKPFIFARVGVRITGVEDMIFSPVQKLDL